MIAKAHHRQGLGSAAMPCWLAWVRAQDRYDVVTLCDTEGDEAALKLYQRLGFRLNSRMRLRKVYFGQIVSLAMIPVASTILARTTIHRNRWEVP